MSTHKVLVTDHPWPSTEAEQRVLAAVGAEMVFATSGQEQELIELAGDADAILTCFAKVTPAVVAAGERLKTIARYGIGVDNIAVEAATERGIVVSNVPSYCEDEVAEHALAMVLALARGLSVFDRATRNGQWSMSTAGPIHRVRGATLGILGFGQIGQAVAGRAAALGLEVIAHHPRLGDEQIRSLGAEPVSMRTLAERSDFLTLHVPLTAETRHLVDSTFLAGMRTHAFLINTARAEVIDQDALIDALWEGRIAGAALDVVTPHPLEAQHPLLGLGNVILTPHVAYYSEESLVELGRLAAENVAAVLAGGTPPFIVNPNALARG